MTENEQELLNIIRGCNDPKRAVEIAISLLIDFVKTHEVPRDTSSVHLRESA